MTGNEYLEYGLQLPNGTAYWGSWANRPLATEEDRTNMVQILKLTAKECGFDEGEFLGRYKWVSRMVTPNNGTWEIDDPSVAPPQVPA